MGDSGQLSFEQISSSGYVVHTLEAVLWTILNYDDFSESVLAAVNLGDGVRLLQFPLLEVPLAIDDTNNINDFLLCSHSIEHKVIADIE